MAIKSVQTLCTKGRKSERVRSTRLLALHRASKHSWGCQTVTAAPPSSQCIDCVYRVRIQGEEREFSFMVLVLFMCRGLQGKRTEQVQQHHLLKMQHALATGNLPLPLFLSSQACSHVLFESLYYVSLSLFIIFTVFDTEKNRRKENRS